MKRKEHLKSYNYLHVRVFGQLHRLFCKPICAFPFLSALKYVYLERMQLVYSKLFFVTDLKIKQISMNALVSMGYYDL